jgi:catechol 2,3-dioxygenase-like lactoylglutathione lyase family enzyme
MHRSLTLAALVLSIAAVRAAATDAPPTLLRTALVVTDIERSVAFYALLGYRPEDEMAGPRDPRKSPFPLAAPSKRSRLVILAGSAGGGKIGLVSFDDPKPPIMRAARAKIGRGDIVFVFDVADASAMHAALTKAGARVIEAPHAFQSRLKDTQGRPYVGKVFHVFDPDGYLIELLQSARPVADSALPDRSVMTRSAAAIVSGR